MANQIDPPVYNEPGYGQGGGPFVPPPFVGPADVYDKNGSQWHYDHNSAKWVMVQPGPGVDPNNPDNPSGGPSGGGGGGSGGVAIGQAYIQAAAPFGEVPTPSQIAALVQKGVSITEYQKRLEWAQWIAENETNLNQFERTLQARGLGGNKPQDPYDWFTNGMPAQVYDVWQEAATRATAANAGFQVGKGFTGDLALSRGDIQYIESTVPSAAGGFDPRTLTTQFQTLAATVQKLATEGRFHDAGLRGRDFQEAIFGGPNQAAIFQKLAQLDASLTAEQKALPNKQLQTRGASTSGGASAY